MNGRPRHPSRRAIALLLSLVLVVASAPAPCRASGLNLFWDQCAAAGGTTTKLFACDANAGAGVLIASVILPADMPMFAATSVVLEFYIADGATPPWWQVAPGQCRANNIRASFDPAFFPESEQCASLWGGQVPLQVQQIQTNIGYNPAHFRLNSGAAVPQGSEIAHVADGTERIAARVLIFHSKTTGADACAGCRTGACIWLSEMRMQQPVGMGDYTVTYPASSNWAGHNATFSVSTAGPNCTTPALNRTWGAIKTLYR